jgi:arsenate reductase
MPKYAGRKFYTHARCSTCKKAEQFLERNSLDFESVDIFSQGPTPTEIKTMIAAYGGDFRKLFNTSGEVYRSLEIKDRTLSESESIKLLAENGRLVKRPFLLFGDGGLVGFKEDQWKAALL